LSTINQSLKLKATSQKKKTSHKAHRTCNLKFDKLIKDNNQKNKQTNKQKSKKEKEKSTHARARTHTQIKTTEQNKPIKQTAAARLRSSSTKLQTQRQTDKYRKQKLTSPPSPSA